MTRIRVAVLLVTTTLFALILGGNLYEQMVIVGRWGDDPPTSLVFFTEIMESGHFEFYMLTPAAIVASLVCLAFVWREATLRSHLLVASISILLVLSLTAVWAFPILGDLFPKQVLGAAAAARQPGRSPAELSELISQFKIMSWVRWLVLLGGFVSLLRAIRQSNATAA